MVFYTGGGVFHIPYRIRIYDISSEHFSLCLKFEQISFFSEEPILKDILYNECLKKNSDIISVLVFAKKKKRVHQS